MTEPSGSLRGPTQTSLATKIILFVFAATFVTATAVSWAAIQQSYAHILQTAREEYPRALTEVAQVVDPWLAAGRRELRSLAAGRALPRSMPQSASFDGLAWLDSRGRAELLLGSASSLDPETRGALLAAAPLVSPGDEVGPLAAVESRGGGRFLIGLYRRDVLERVLAEALPHPGGSMLLVDAESRVIASSPQAGTLTISRAKLPEGERSDPVQRYTNASGEKVLGTGRSLESAPWSLIFEVPFAQVFAPVLSAATRLFVIDLVVVLVFSILAYWITTAWVRPIEALSDTARRIAQGDLDHEIPEPETDDEIGLLTHTFNDMIRKLRRNQTEIESANRTLRSRNEILSQLSITDGLTHLHNHRFFQDHLGREIKRVTRLSEPLSMLLIDIDDFKSLNDRLGHAAGDELLSGMARIMDQCVRDSDLLARYGGEEFVVLTSNTDRTGAYRLAEKIRMNIEDASFIVDESLRPVRVTVSIGVAQFAGNRKRFFESADQALYRAKAAGKNCVISDEAIDEEAEATETPQLA